MREGDAGTTVKLQKRLAEAGLGSRRAMEELIQSGEVLVNGHTAKIGMRVGAEDRITVAGKIVGRVRASGVEREPQILLYHKPEGEIVSRADPEGRPSVFDRVPAARRGRWLAVGRLDFNTCGLLIFTDSGELANRLTHPRYRARRDYAVRLVGELSAEQLRKLRSGIALEDGLARFDAVEAQGGEGTNRWYRVRVREGRNRLVRRMFAALGMTVSRLMRTGFGPFDLPSRVKRGHWLKLEPAEVAQALARLERDEREGEAAQQKRLAVNGSPPSRAPRAPASEREAKPPRPKFRTTRSPGGAERIPGTADDTSSPRIARFALHPGYEATHEPRAKPPRYDTRSPGGGAQRSPATANAAMSPGLRAARPVRATGRRGAPADPRAPARTPRRPRRRPPAT